MILFLPVTATHLFSIYNVCNHIQGQADNPKVNAIVLLKGPVADAGMLSVQIHTCTVII